MDWLNAWGLNNMVRGEPLITAQLRTFIESEYESGGFINAGGDRVVVIPRSISSLARMLGCSVGTVKNAFAALEKSGYILAREADLYLRLAPIIDTPIRPEKREIEEEEGEDEIEGDVPNSRLDEALVRGIVHSLLTAPDVNRQHAVMEAKAFIRAHRSWCVRNGYRPWL